MNLTDEELIKKIKQHDTMAFETLIRRYYPRVYNWVRTTVPASAAEDVVQDVFLALQNTIYSFNAQSSFSTYLFTLTRHKIADYYRKSEQETAHILRTEKAPPEAEDLEGKVLDQEMIHKILSSLPDVEAQILIMRLLEGHAFREIARMLELSYEAVRSKYRRAIEKCSEYNKRIKIF